MIAKNLPSTYDSTTLLYPVLAVSVVNWTVENLPESHWGSKRGYQEYQQEVRNGKKSFDSGRLLSQIYLAKHQNLVIG